MSVPFLKTEEIFISQLWIVCWTVYLWSVWHLFTSFLLKHSRLWIQRLYVMFKWWISAALLRLESESWTWRCFVSVFRFQARAWALPPRFFLLLRLPDLFLFPSMPHYETSPLIGQREPYHLRRARRHHSGLIYDCTDQIIKSPAEHRQRLAAHFQLPAHTGAGKSESWITLRNGRHGTGLCVLTQRAEGFPPVMDARCCMGW